MKGGKPRAEIRHIASPDATFWKPKGNIMTFNGLQTG